MVLEQSAQGVAVLPETPTGEAKLFFKAKKKSQKYYSRSVWNMLQNDRCTTA